jgi:RNA-splicing ligase RtcB
MKLIDGKYATAKVFTDNIEESASQQILSLCNQSFVDGCKIRIMPDVHAGTGCVIGFTADLGNKVIPSIVGVDIGCGMLVAELGKNHIDPKKLDEVIHGRVPAGMAVHEEPTLEENFLDDLTCKDSLHNIDRIVRSLGTLGGGNHFIELDKDEDDNQYLVIHTGSRNLGKQVAEYYQNVATSNLKGKNKKKEAVDALINQLKAEGREKEISQKLSELNFKFPDIPNELCYLEGKDREAYLHDMKICQNFATMNRLHIMNEILNGVGLQEKIPEIHFFQTVHNYIDMSDNIIRKGSVSAKKGERLIIPLNMKDGSLICIGKGNPDWNCSAPHGAGRMYSRVAAKKAFSIDEFKKQMDGIYSTSVNEGTLDECPMAYKPAQEIIDAISPTVEIINHIKPVYNFKAGE